MGTAVGAGAAESEVNAAKHAQRSPSPSRRRRGKPTKSGFFAQVTRWLYSAIIGPARKDERLLYVATEALAAAGASPLWLPRAILGCSAVPRSMRRHHLIVEIAVFLFDRWISPVDDETRERLDNQLCWLEAHGSPPETLIKGISHLAFKAPSKRTLPYLVGILRAWQVFGVYRMITTDHHMLWDALRDELGMPLSLQDRQRWLLLSGKYGALPTAIATLRTIHGNPAGILAAELERRLLDPMLRGGPEVPRSALAGS